MTEEPTVKSPEAQSPPHGPERNPPTVTTPRRSTLNKILREKILRKKVMVPVAMFGLGALLLLIGLAIYPQRADATPAATDHLDIVGDNWVNSHVDLINYNVRQVHPDVADIFVGVWVPSTRIPHGARVVIHLIQPRGLPVPQCLGHCAADPSGTVGAVAYFAPSGQAAALFVLKARSVQVAANGANAAVSFPEVNFTGTHQVTMQLAYQDGIPAANSYDWSSYPPTSISKSLVFWAESVGQGPTNGRVVFGVNSAAQAHDGNLILASGILFGIGGGALVAGIQEWLRG